jgi:glycosyltransferase involved in cell wall biosynthesis
MSEMSAKLTVLIPCKNERLNIRACIESAREAADEILVADSGSTDETLEIARAAGGCRIIERKWVGYADFKNWAIPQARHEWVLILDADERVTPELAAEIRKLLANPPAEIDAFLIRRRTFFLGREIRYSGWRNETITRLIRRDVCRYRNVRVHEEIDIDPKRVGTLSQALLHYSFPSYADLMEKQLRYSRLAALDAFERGKRASWLKLLTIFPIRFLQSYVLRLGFLDGLAGIQICTLIAFGSFLKQGRLWELEQTNPHPDPLPEGEGEIRRKEAA